MDALTSTIQKTPSPLVLTTRPSDSHRKQQTDPTTNEPHPSLTHTDSMIHVDYTQETENIEMLEEETQTAPQFTQNETPCVNKWDDLINTEIDAEQDQVKHGTKRDKSKLKNKDIKDENESDDSTMETMKYSQTQM